MYLKVNDSKRDLYFYFEEKQPIIIGRSPACDITIVTDGVSRNHLKVEAKDGSYFVTDLGSTNGTFVNEVQLVKDKSEPLNTFFPAKLGFNVYVHLMDESDTKSLDELVARTKEELEEGEA